MQDSSLPIKIKTHGMQNPLLAQTPPKIKKSMCFYNVRFALCNPIHVIFQLYTLPLLKFTVKTHKLLNITHMFISFIFLNTTRAPSYIAQPTYSAPAHLKQPTPSISLFWFCQRIEKKKTSQYTATCQR